MKPGKPPAQSEADRDEQIKLAILAAVFFSVRLWRFRFDAAPSGDVADIRKAMASDAALDAAAVVAAVKAIPA
jgi:hypothetical protein